MVSYKHYPTILFLFPQKTHSFKRHFELQCSSDVAQLMLRVLSCRLRSSLGRGVLVWEAAAAAAAAVVGMRWSWRIPSLQCKTNFSNSCLVAIGFYTIAFLFYCVLSLVQYDVSASKAVRWSGVPADVPRVRTLLPRCIFLIFFFPFFFHAHLPNPPSPFPNMYKPHHPFCPAVCATWGSSPSEAVDAMDDAVLGAEAEVTPFTPTKQTRGQCWWWILHQL